MPRFIDEYAPLELPGYPCLVRPKRFTQIVTTLSGSEQVNQVWSYSKRLFTLPSAVRKHEHYAAVLDHWECMDGPNSLWPFRDPLDFASIKLTTPNVVPTLSATDQPLGTGDGTTTDFQLAKTYTRGAQTHSRPVFLPVVDTILIAMNGIEPAEDSPPVWTVTRVGGVVSFASPPDPGVALTWGGLFDVPVHFEDDNTLEGIFKNWQTAGYSDVVLVEAPLCSDDV